MIGVGDALADGWSHEFPTPDDLPRNADHGDLQVSTDCFSDALVHPSPPPHIPSHTLRAGPSSSVGSDPSNDDGEERVGETVSWLE